ncbi:MAG TPA: aspartyl/glutamyl-tRNA amidotransferase subunit C [Treponemataceae bacterium]|jgi:aspartyl-tRNA(Asn)/glutamyl-tRNA(Gln) amidotransferase subunit C|nr:MAG: aspartyl/glutamyl-tRNA amidotransferase subunit C [Spirochaetes bacterium ADurb.Bin269]TAH54452.1 MAG: Asp-tRNA(Asn)/Glu-tRNA(Gln) amidotransferase GatCAB subunit C [Treponema sp.]HOC29952.1 aspartyl/glutamyl-tRNA amidotransferase subunit C [Treponemataceae bacterium]HPX47455.1 aspartyl/glutamyl-tRNA amidotransferase subunit C [Treponemataceae bacterium]HQL33817.1 aspartyl/glutamyl-tRNA amidotransferase subunit C [Treponemataceae bacterium]
MDEKKQAIDQTTFENLLYLSRLSPDSTNVEILAGQVRQIVDYFDVLSQYAGDENPYDAYPSTTVENLRPGEVRASLEQTEVRKITNEFMDGYFRVPKVLGGGA